MDALPSVVEGEVIAEKYRIERVIGEGGMGVVVAAFHLQLNRRVALKFLRAEAGGSSGGVARFLREAQALACITGPHVARVMDVGTLKDGQPYLVMEYLDGSDLRSLLTDLGPLPILEAVGYVLQAAEAIAEAHANGIVHRDLKPSNLFLTRGADAEPLIKVLDFGISKGLDSNAESSFTTQTGALVGSPAYMSPEQIRDAKRVDERSDIWALGVILHELVSGELPFRGESVSGTLAAIAADQAIPVRVLRQDVPAQLESVILRCLEKNPERRFATVAEFARALLSVAPEEAERQVARIERLLSGNVARVAQGESADEPPFGGTVQATLPTGPGAPWSTEWALGEGQTSVQKRMRAAPPLLIASGILLLLVVGAAFLVFSRSEPRRVLPARVSASAIDSSAVRAVSAEREPRAVLEPTAVPPPSVAVDVFPGAASGQVRPRKPGPSLARPARALTPAVEGDGTSDRK